MDVISYSQVENYLEVPGKIDLGYKQISQKIHFDKNPTLTRYISKLSDQYDRYKESYNFPSKYKGRMNYKKSIFNFQPDSF